MYKYILLILLSCFYIDGKCQSLLGKDYPTIAKGIGITKKLAINDALNNAIESVYKVAIHSVTTVSDDVIQSDSITVSSVGNIRKYKLLSDSVIGGNHHVIINADVYFTTLNGTRDSKQSKIKIKKKL